MTAIGPPLPDEDRTPIAWRCEQDRKLHPASEPSYVVYIEEIGAAYHGTTTKRRPYFIRRMIVCRPCRRTIGNFDASTPTGGTQGATE
jgi:hypothetical protein